MFLNIKDYAVMLSATGYIQAISVLKQGGDIIKYWERVKKNMYAAHSA
jgi:hypothetical protein